MKKFLGVITFLLYICNVFSQDIEQIKWVEVANMKMSDDFRDTPIFRLPVMLICKNGDIVISAEAKSSNDQLMFYVMAISKDGGKSFKTKRSQIPMPELVYDQINDRIICFGNKIFYASDNHGETWYDFNSTFQIKIPNGFDFYNMSPTTGIQLKNGILVIPMRFVRLKRDEKGKHLESIEKATNFLLYSKDGGKNWAQSPMTPSDIIADEATIAEYMDNQVMINSRGGTEYFWDATNNGRRVFVPTMKLNSSVKKWKIDGWKLEKESDGKIYDPICHASFIKANISGRKVGLFCNPDMPGQYSPRKNLCLWASRDFKHWIRVAQMTPPDYPVLGYSAMAYRNGKLYFAYEDKNKGILFCNLETYKETIIKRIKK